MMYSPQNFVSWSIELLTILWPNLNIKLLFESGIYVIFSKVKKNLKFSNAKKFLSIETEVKQQNMKNVEVLDGVTINIKA